jgi:DNA-binding NarL/FixJ family response regulator
VDACMADQNKTSVAATHVVMISSDAQFREMVAQTFSSQLQISLESFEGDLTEVPDSALAHAAVIVVDLDAGSEAQIAALARITARQGAAPAVIVTQLFDGPSRAASCKFALLIFS